MVGNTNTETSNPPHCERSLTRENRWKPPRAGLFRQPKRRREDEPASGLPACYERSEQGYQSASKDSSKEENDGVWQIPCRLTHVDYSRTG